MYIHIIYTQVGVADAVCDQENEGAPDQGAGMRLFCVYVCMRACIICVCMHVCMHVPTYVHPHACIRSACLFSVCMHVYIYLTYI